MTIVPPPPTPPQGEGPDLRRWGIGLGIGGILVAVAIAAQSCGDDPPTAPAAPPDVAASPPGEAPSGADAPAAAPETPDAADDPAQAAPAAVEPRPSARPARTGALCPEGGGRPEILVAFERSHPMNEAQRLFAEGRREEARALAARLLAERRDLRGLCLARFTIGGAEIVVGAPNAASAADWTDRLNGMDGVAYAEQNLVVAPF